MEEEQKRRILIIEDEALVARELKTRLTQMGWDVVGIAYGSEGIELARDTEPDLLLTDIHLRDDEDGIEIAGIIQSERDVPVVFLTAYSDDDTVSRAKALTPYGYIIKPVDNRELQIVIEMALYKFEIEKELRKTQQLLETALTCIGNGLVFVDREGLIRDLNQDAEVILDTNREEAIDSTWSEVFSLIGSSVRSKIVSALSGGDVTKLAPFVVSSSEGVSRLVDGIVGPLEDGGVLILRELTEITEPIEMLPTTDELLARVGTDRLTPTESSMCQLLIAPQIESDAELNEEVSHLLNQLVRSTDLVSIYGHSQLSVSMPYTSVSEGKLIAESVLKALTDRFALRDLNYSIGLSYSYPGDQQPFEVFRRASWALKIAQDAGGDRVVVWNEETERDPESFGSETEKQREYHNLVLLWNVLNVVAKSADWEEAGEKICNHMVLSFDLGRAAVLALQNGSLISLVGASRGPKAYEGLEDLAISGDNFLRIQEFFGSDADHIQLEEIHLLKLSSEKVLFLDSSMSTLSSDIDFLKSISAYFGAGLARFEMSASSSLSELEESAIIYSSASMTSILESIQLVAPTDATVLIAGESGTGKELLARTIHQNSARKEKPFIIVDCGAVVGSLIESELFGHVKGAFTGAEKRFSGRLKEADGGTVLLDEIGELPLDVQVKLLRFVQEREIAAVGSSNYESIDTRVIAATNRDLKSLVDEGKFREDLYYRLNVFSIDAPPLRERREDILLLAHHYLAIYSNKYDKKSLGFTEDAELALKQHAWPGNIRELINVINRGIILCKDSRLSTIHLGIFPTGSEPDDSNESADTAIPLDTWMRGIVESCLTAYEQLPPLGQWLEEEVIKVSLAANSDVLNRAAISLGIPESTLRRKAARIRELSTGDHEAKPADLNTLQSIVGKLNAEDRTGEESVLNLVSDALLRELERRNLNKKDAAKIMGVSLPTYRRMST